MLAIAIAAWVRGYGVGSRVRDCWRGGTNLDAVAAEDLLEHAHSNLLVREVVIHQKNLDRLGPLALEKV